MFATLDFTLADTAISLYDAKYHYLVWRPVTAIRAGVPGVTANPKWNPLLPTAPDPSYPGAHSGFSFAAATVLSAFFGADLPVTVHSDGEPGAAFSYRDFFAAARGRGAEPDLDRPAHAARRPCRASPRQSGRHVRPRPLRPDPRRTGPPGKGLSLPAA
jgi:hypothetical protein